MSVPTTVGVCVGAQPIYGKSRPDLSGGGCHRMPTDRQRYNYRLQPLWQEETQKLVQSLEVATIRLRLEEEHKQAQSQDRSRLLWDVSCDDYLTRMKTNTLCNQWTQLLATKAHTTCAQRIQSSKQTDRTSSPTEQTSSTYMRMCHIPIQTLSDSCLNSWFSIAQCPKKTRR